MFTPPGDATTEPQYAFVLAPPETRAYPAVPVDPLAETIPPSVSCVDVIVVLPIACAVALTSEFAPTYTPNVFAVVVAVELATTNEVAVWVALTVELPTLIVVVLRFTLAPTLTAVVMLAVAGRRAVLRVPELMFVALV